MINFIRCASQERGRALERARAGQSVFEVEGEFELLLPALQPLGRRRDPAVSLVLQRCSGGNFNFKDAASTTTPTRSCRCLQDLLDQSSYVVCGFKRASMYYLDTHAHRALQSGFEAVSRAADSNDVKRQRDKCPPCPGVRKSPPSSSHACRNDCHDRCHWAGPASPLASTYRRRRSRLS